MSGDRIVERDTPSGRERMCALNESEACKGWTPLEEFLRAGDGKPRALCKACNNARKKRYWEEGRLTHDKARHAELDRAYKAAHKDAILRQHREYIQRVKADREKHRQYLETRRMNYRLKREREGFSVRPANRPPDRRMLPSAPLLTLVERIIDERTTIADVIDDPDFARIETVCADLGLAPRKFREWRKGTMPNVTLAVAEDVMLAADVDPSDVYSHDDHADVLALFGTGVVAP